MEGFTFLLREMGDGFYIGLIWKSGWVWCIIENDCKKLDIAWLVWYGKPAQIKSRHLSKDVFPGLCVMWFVTGSCERCDLRMWFWARVEFKKYSTIVPEGGVFTASTRTMFHFPLAFAFAPTKQGIFRLLCVSGSKYFSGHILFYAYHVVWRTSTVVRITWPRREQSYESDI